MMFENPSRAALAPLWAMVILLAGCGRSADSPGASPGSGKPDVIVIIDGKRHACIAALSTEAQGSTIACADVVSFVKDELRVPSGSTYELRSIADVDPAEMAKAGAALTAAGYRALGTLKP